MLLISAGLEPHIREALISLLKEYTDAFGWSYEDMPGLNPELVKHRLVLYPDAKPMKQELRRLHPKVVLQVKDEVNKFYKVKFIKLVYPKWVANIVPVQKKTKEFVSALTSEI